MANVMDLGIVMCVFELYYVHFRTDTLEKATSTLNPQAMG